MSKTTQPVAADPQPGKDKEASLYLPAELKAQIESLKITPSEKTVDVVRRLVATAEHQKQQATGETVMVVLTKLNYNHIFGILRAYAPQLSDILQRSKR